MTIRKMGFSAVEIWGMYPHFEYRNMEFLEKTAQYMKEEGLKAPSFHSPFYLSISDAYQGKWLHLATTDEANRKKAVEETIFCLQAMSIFNSSILTIHCTGYDDESERDLLVGMRKSLDQLLPLACDAGITLAMENDDEPPLSKEAMVNLVNEYRTPYLGICLDIGHSNLNENPIEVLKKFAPFLVNLHIHDNFGQNDEHLIPFDGNIKWEKIIQELVNFQYDKLLTFEIKWTIEDLQRISQAKEKFKILETKFKNSNSKRKKGIL